MARGLLRICPVCGYYNPAGFGDRDRCPACEAIQKATRENIEGILHTHVEQLQAFERDEEGPPSLHIALYIHAYLSKRVEAARAKALRERAKHPCWQIELGGDNWRELIVRRNGELLSGVYKLSLTYDSLHGPELHIDSMPGLGEYGAHLARELQEH